MKKSSKPIGSNKKTRILVVLVAIALIASCSWVAGKLVQSNDSHRFAETDALEQKVFGELVEKLGTPIRIEDKNTCYNSEQGPYDNGRLWCQVADAAYYDNLSSESNIKEALKSILEENAIDVITGASGDLAFRSSENITCGLDIYEGVLAQDPGYYFPETSAAKQTVVVLCADRANAKHYPYID